MTKELFLQGKSLRKISRETGKSLTTVRYWHSKYKANLPPKLITLPDSEITAAVSSAKSLAEALRLLNRSYVGSNYRFLQTAISRLQLDTSHWERFGRHIPKTKISWEHVLVEKSPYALTTSRRRRLVLEGLLKNICAICSQVPQWNGYPLTLRLDHVNGKRNDHRITNLRFVCPNCDSQLPTYCSKNRTYQRNISLANSTVRVAVSKTENTGSIPVRGTIFSVDNNSEPRIIGLT